MLFSLSNVWHYLNILRIIVKNKRVIILSGFFLYFKTIVQSIYVQKLNHLCIENKSFKSCWLAHILFALSIIYCLHLWVLNTKIKYHCNSAENRASYHILFFYQALNYINDFYQYISYPIIYLHILVVEMNFISPPVPLKPSRLVFVIVWWIDLKLAVLLYNEKL